TLRTSQLRRRRLEYRTHLRRGAGWSPVSHDQTRATAGYRGRPELGPDIARWSVRTAMFATLRRRLSPDMARYDVVDAVGLSDSMQREGFSRASARRDRNGRSA